MDYFSFEIGDQKVGYYEEEDDGSVFYCNALMEMEGEKYENPFWVKYEGTRILAYKFGDGDFIDLDQPAGVYPSAALNILVRGMADGETRTFTSFNEGKGEVVGQGTVTRSGERIEETLDDKPWRYVVLNDAGNIVEYGWGGNALSRKVGSLAEAKADTAFA